MLAYTCLDHNLPELLTHLRLSSTSNCESAVSVWEDPDNTRRPRWGPYVMIVKRYKVSCGTWDSFLC